MSKSIVDTISSFIQKVKDDKNHRYTSWEHCYEAFGNSKTNISKEEREHLALHLAFYLASWGMYRGSSGLLQKNYLVHLGAVDIIMEYKQVGKNDNGAIIDLKGKLEAYYGGITFIKENVTPVPKLSTTDTLISKIILGALGCVPAYDRYFILGLKEVAPSIEVSFNKKSLDTLSEFANDNIGEIQKIQMKIKNELGTDYPTMKIIDMHFWQIGYDKAVKYAEEQKRIKEKEKARKAMENSSN